MATCSSCGSELTGQYCAVCGARAPEERAPKKPKSASKPSHGSVHKTPGLLSPQRIWKSVSVVVFALLIFGSGVFTGIYITKGDEASAGVDPGEPALEAGVDLSSLNALGRANYYMEKGVGLLNQGQRAAAVNEFRRSLREWEQAVKDEPENLYAQTYQGLTYYYAGDSTKALATLRAVLEKDPNYLWAIFNLAWIYETGGKKPEALQMYQKYVAVVDEEKKNVLKYAEQFELIDRQAEAARQAIAGLTEGGSGQ